MLYPLTFQPIFKERLWGSRTLQTLYGKELPADRPIGESWEITDRPEAVSVINQGPLAGKNLHWLTEHHREELMGSVPLLNGRFPLLAKILDAQEKLSLQVHPPAAVAASLDGEPKTEVWFVAAAQPEADLYVGLKRGVTRRQFEEHLRAGTVAECCHRVPVRAGAAMFVPSGRLHGIGAGCVIFEIQQSSDTTYRVFDWNRVDANGQARALHIEQSMASIDFSDFEPALLQPTWLGSAEATTRPLVSCPFFEVELRRLAAGAVTEFGAELLIVAVVAGELELLDNADGLTLTPGAFCLLPAGLRQTRCRAVTAAEILVTRPR